MEEITISENVSGLLLYAVPKQGQSTYLGEWLVLVSKVEKNEMLHCYHFNYFFCVDLSNGRTCISVDGEGGWGFTDKYTFYKPNEEQRKRVVKGMRNRGYKYISSLKKIVKKI
jgi:hypothetical protein